MNGTSIWMQLSHFASIMLTRPELVNNLSSRSDWSLLGVSVCRLYLTELHCTNASKQFTAGRSVFQTDLRSFQAQVSEVMLLVILNSSSSIFDVHCINRGGIAHEKLWIGSPRKKRYMAAIRCTATNGNLWRTGRIGYIHLFCIVFAFFALVVGKNELCRLLN